MSGDFIPDDENGDLLRRLVRNGADLSQPRDIDYQVVFRNEQDAVSFAAAMGRQGFRTRIERCDVVAELPWDVTATKWMQPRHADITATERQLQEIADFFGGRNDGWGCFD